MNKFDCLLDKFDVDTFDVWWMCLIVLLHNFYSLLDRFDCRLVKFDCWTYLKISCIRLIVGRTWFLGQFDCLLDCLLRRVAGYKAVLFWKWP